MISFLYHTLIATSSGISRSSVFPPLPYNTTDSFPVAIIEPISSRIHAFNDLYKIIRVLGSNAKLYSN